MREAERALDYWTPEQEDYDTLVSMKLLTRNTRLIEARRDRGVTQVQMAQDIGMPYFRLSNIANLRRLPTDDDMARIARYLERTIDYLFPPVLIRAIEAGVFDRRDAQLAEPEIISLTEAQQLYLTYDGESEIIDQLDRQLLSERLKNFLEELKPREAEVIRLKFGLVDGRSRSLREVGDIFGVGRERIRQIEAKALRKLRHPSRSRNLKDFLD